MHALACARLHLPAAHETHVALALAPTAALEVPASQGVHSLRPALGPYVPASHCTQESVVDPALELYRPAAHSVHAPVTAAPLHEPGSQLVQLALLVAPVPDPYMPAPQAVQAVAPLAEAQDPAAQAAQSLAACLPVSPFDVPGVHRLYLLEPLGQKLPAGHTVCVEAQEPAGQ